MKITMPKACISCNHFTGTGYKADSINPMRDQFGGRISRSQFGSCSAHCKDVYATEICGSFEHDDLIAVVEVENRAEPMQPHQELMGV